MTSAMILAAIGAGLGLFAIVLSFLPAQPDLREVIARQSTVSTSVIDAPAPDRPDKTPADPTAEGIELSSSDQAASKVGLRFASTLQALPFVKIPVSDLYVLRKPVSVFLGEKVLLSVIGLIGPAFVAGAHFSASPCPHQQPSSPPCSWLACCSSSPTPMCRTRPQKRAWSSATR